MNIIITLVSLGAVIGAVYYAFQTGRLMQEAQRYRDQHQQVGTMYMTVLEGHPPCEVHFVGPDQHPSFKTHCDECGAVLVRAVEMLGYRLKMLGYGKGSHPVSGTP